MSRKEDIHMFPPDISTKVKKKKLQRQIKIIRQNFKKLPLPQTRVTNKATPTTWDQ